MQRGRLAADEAWGLAATWLRAHDIRALVVIGSQYASAALWRRLAALATEARLTIALIGTSPRLTRAQRELLGGPITRWRADAFTSWISQLPPADRAPPRARRTPFPAVPVDELPFFRASCARLLGAEAFDVVDAAYRAAFRSTERWLSNVARPLTEECTGAFLADLISDADGIHDQLTRIRGAQAAFWRARWLLKVHVDVLAAAYRAHLDGIDRHAAADLLNGYVSPRTAALAAITLRTQLPPGRLALLNAQQLTHHCRALNLGEGPPITFGPERPLLIAHRLEAERRGQDPRGALFCDHHGQRLRPKAIKQLLRRTSAETGLALTQTWSPPTQRQHAYWMHRRGLSIQPLAEHAQ